MRATRELALDTRAKVLVIAKTATRSASLSRLLNEWGYRSVEIPPERDAFYRHQSSVDCAIVDGSLDDGLIEALRDDKDNSEVPLLVIAPKSTADGSKDLSAGDSVLHRPLQGGHLSRKVATLVRLCTTRSEWYRRLRTYRRLDIDTATVPDLTHAKTDAETTILVAGDPSRDYSAIEAKLSDERTVVVGTFTPATAADYIGRHSFDLVLLNVENDPDPYYPVVSAMRRNVRFKLTPVLLVTPRHKNFDPGAAYRSGVTDILQRPLEDDTLLRRVQIFLREARIRAALKRAYAAPRPQAALHADTGTFSRRFLLAHLANLLDHSEATGRPTSLGLLDFNELDAIADDDHYVAAKLFHEVSSMTEQLVRMEDLVAYVGPNRLAIAFPNTAGSFAATAARRVSSVIQNTELRGPMGRGICLHPNAVASTANPGETPENFLERVTELL